MITNLKYTFIFDYLYILRS